MKKKQVSVEILPYVELPDRKFLVIGHGVGLGYTAQHLMREKFPTHVYFLLPETPRLASDDGIPLIRCYEMLNCHVSAVCLHPERLNGLQSIFPISSVLEISKNMDIQALENGDFSLRQIFDDERIPFMLITSEGAGVGGSGMLYDLGPECQGLALIHEVI